MNLFIRQFCTSDIENFGDVLYPILLDKACVNRYPVFNIEKYAFIAGIAPFNAGYSNINIRSIFQNNTQHMPLIIGGGDIIRTDDLVVASHYRSHYIDLMKHRKEQVKPVIIGEIRRKDFTIKFFYDPFDELINEVWFKKNLMPPCDFSFILSPAICPAISSTFFFSVGVPFEIDTKYHGLIRSAFDKAAYIYVRDNQSKEKLLRVGVKNNIVVAPDVAILTSTFFPKNELYHLKDEALSSIGFEKDKSYICYQMNMSGMNNIYQIAQSLSEITQCYGLKVVLLPLGLCHGDVAALQAVSNLVPDATKVLKTNNIWHMLAIIAHSALFVGGSLHGNIVAYSYDVPYLFTPLNVNKITGAIDMLRISSQCRLNTWDQLSLSISNSLERKKPFTINKDHRIESQERAMMAVNALFDSIQ